jgi:hypothetical protein
MEATKDYPNLKPWKPGQSGNLNGRPVGTRQAFSAGFHRDLAEVWQSHGRDSMLHTAKTNPTVFFATCARLIGPEVKMTIEAQPVGLEPQDIVILKAIRAAIPDADRMSAEQVLQHVLDAVQAHESKGYLGSAEAEGLRLRLKKGGMTH